MPPRTLLERVTKIARQAGSEILEVYASGAPATTAKADDSPLTAADLRSHRLIVAALRALTPDVPVLSEESARTPYAQ
ncbi:MAG: 3'(2'),5'-bisphosphate nucleotidase CysQ, partial [Steroidobacteraceae bacterium]